eukprot:g27779.t1
MGCVFFTNEPKKLQRRWKTKVCGKDHATFNDLSLRDDVVLAVMAICCAGIVLSNSTFSWWAAIFGGYKVVLAPEMSGDGSLGLQISPWGAGLGGKEAKERLPSSSELLGLFASAVLQDPSNVEAIFGMGVFLEVSHRPMEMLRWMDLVLELQPKHLGAWEARSRAQEHRGRLSEALAGYRQLASLDTARTRPRDALLEHQQVYVLPMEVWSEGVAEDLQVAAKHPSCALAPETKED